MTMSYKVGKIIKIIWEEETESMQVVLEITDSDFKDRVLHSKDFQDVLSFEGKDVMIVARRKNNADV